MVARFLGSIAEHQSEKRNVNKPLDSDIVRLDLDTGQLTALTTQLGQDLAPQISPDGERMAWVGNEDAPGLAHIVQ